jgi:hypothetical protein
MSIYTFFTIIFGLYAFRDWLAYAYDSIENQIDQLYLLRRQVLKKKIKIEINHAGNQKIPEFYDAHGNKKSITFELPEDSTILDVKDEIAKQVKYADRSISLFKSPFGKKLLNTTNIICFHDTEPLHLYIVIPDY